MEDEVVKGSWSCFCMAWTSDNVCIKKEVSAIGDQAEPKKIGGKNPFF